MVLSMICLIYGLDTLNHYEIQKTNMVLSDLILGWSQLMTGHADSLIISYLKDATCLRFSLRSMSVRSGLAAHSPPERADCHWEKW